MCRSLVILFITVPVRRRPMSALFPAVTAAQFIQLRGTIRTRLEQEQLACLIVILLATVCRIIGGIRIHQQI